MSDHVGGVGARDFAVPGSALTFDAVIAANASRSWHWHRRSEPWSEPWSGADWSNAMQGEAGEAGNVVKKLRRIETRVPGSQDAGRDSLIVALGDEIADTFLYLALLADHYEVDMPRAIARKFNLVSAREGFPHRILVEGVPTWADDAS